MVQSYSDFRALDPSKYIDDVSPGRTATIVIAASNASLQSKAQADIVCDGVNDEVEIQAALTALPAGGGKITLSEGIFYIQGPIFIRSNLRIEGSGPATELRIIGPIDSVFRDPVSTTPATSTLTVAVNIGDTVITVVSTAGMNAGDSFILGSYVADLQTILSVDSPTQITLVNPSDIDKLAGRSVYTISPGFQEHIEIVNMRFYVPVDGLAPGESTYAVFPWAEKYFSLEGCQFINDSPGTLRTRGGYLKYCSMKNNYYKKCEITSHGKLLSVVSGNVAVNCTGNSLAGDCQSTVISNNVLIRSSRLFYSNDASHMTIVGNISINSSTLVNIVSGHHNVIVGNRIHNCLAMAIYLEGTSTYDNLVSDNLIVNPTGYGIEAHHSTKNVIQNNVIIGGAGTGIWITGAGADSNKIVGNKIKDVGGYGIYIDTTPLNNRVAGNYCENCTLGNLRLDGPGTIWAASAHDLFMDVLAVSATYVRSNQVLSGGLPITFTIDAQPDVPRTLSGHFDAHVNITAYTIVIVGVDAKGYTVTETKTFAVDGWDWETNNAFATITSIKLTVRTGTGVGDTMDIGVTDVLGLSNEIYATSDVYKIKKNNADAVVAVAQVNTTYDTYDMAVIGLAVGDDFTIWFRSNLNVVA